MGEVWPTARITELCLQLTGGSRPVNGNEHRALRSQSCERGLVTTGDFTFFYLLCISDLSLLSKRAQKYWPVSAQASWQTVLRSVKLTREPENFTGCCDQPYSVKINSIEVEYSCAWAGA